MVLLNPFFSLPLSLEFGSSNKTPKPKERQMKMKMKIKTKEISLIFSNHVEPLCGTFGVGKLTTHISKWFQPFLGVDLPLLSSNDATKMAEEPFDLKQITKKKKKTWFEFEKNGIIQHQMRQKIQKIQLPIENKMKKRRKKTWFEF